MDTDLSWMKLKVKVLKLHAGKLHLNSDLQLAFNNGGDERLCKPILEVGEELGIKIIKEDSSLPDFSIVLTHNAKPDFQVKVPDKEEAYSIAVNSNGIFLNGNDSAGLFYGLGLLMQIIGNCGKKLPAFMIEDWPDISFRAYAPFFGGHLFTKDSANPKEYRKWIKTLVEGRFNHISFELEAFERDEDLKNFSELCRSNFIEPIPLHPFATLSRTNNIVKYVNAGEDDFIEMMRPVDRAIKLVRPKYFCIAGDELVSSYDFFQRESIYTVEQRKKRAPWEWLYAFIMRLYNYLRKNGVQMAMWADGLLDIDDFYGHPFIQTFGGAVDYHCEMADKLPKDIIMWDWQYQPSKEYPTTARLLDLGFRTVSCPAVKGAIGNCELFAGYVHKTRNKNLLGMLCTDWEPALKRETIGKAASVGDCFWTAGKSGEKSESLRRIKDLLMNNPFINIVEGQHDITVLADDDELIGGIPFLAHSLTGQRYGRAVRKGFGARHHRWAVIDYALTAEEKCIFDSMIFEVEINDVFTQKQILISRTEFGENFSELCTPSRHWRCNISDLIKGAKVFRLRLKGFNATASEAVFISKIQVACKIIKDKV